MKKLVYIFSCFTFFSFKAQENILTIADSMPKFPGGTTAMAKFIQMNLLPPGDILEGSKSEKTFVKFVIDKEGKVKNPVIIKPSNYKSFDAEAIRVISKMPDWQPGLNQGEKVSVYMTLPISYKNIGIVKPEPVSPEHENAMKYWNEGHKLEQQFKFGNALEKYNKCLEIEPQNKFALFDKAKMYLALGDKKMASEVLNKMVEQNIRKDEAEDLIKKYCGENDEGSKFLKELKSAHFFANGMDDVRSSRYEAALRKFDSSLKYTPEHKNALFNKAEMHRKLNQNKAACITWKTLLQITPEDKEVEDLIKKNCN